MFVLLADAAGTNVSIDLSTIIAVFLTLLTALVGAGWFTSRRVRSQQDSERLKNDADAKRLSAEAESTTVLTHAQYEGFISEASERLTKMQEAAISRMEADLAKAQAQMAELRTELERARGDRNEAIATAAVREMQLQGEINNLKRRISDLERRLEVAGIKGRRTDDKKTYGDNDPDNIDTG